MWYLYRFLLLVALLFSSSAQAIKFYADALWWQASETIDWCLTNDLHTPNQTVAYKTIKFNFEPGFRLGIGHEGNWDTRLLFTRYTTQAQDSANGNVVSAFMAGKLAQPIYQSGQVDFAIHFNMFDGDMSKSFKISEAIIVRPLIGLRGGWINQQIDTSFQNPISVVEKANNNFRGFGPKVGIESAWMVYCRNKYQLSLVSHFTTSFMWGNWVINDVLHENVGPTIHVNVGKRDLGAFAVQGFLGLNLDCKGHSLKIGYEIADWFNQFQVLDDATGAHNNDLVLQGLTIALTY